MGFSYDRCGRHGKIKFQNIRPATNKRCKVVGLFEAGPRVATIFARRLRIIRRPIVNVQFSLMNIHLLPTWHVDSKLALDYHDTF